RWRASDPDHRLLSVEARGGVAELTAHHTMIDSDGDLLPAGQVESEDELALCDEMPETPCWTVATDELAELLGLLVADGYVHRDGKGICFTNNSAALRLRVAELWSRTFLGQSAEYLGRS